MLTNNQRRVNKALTSGSRLLGGITKIVSYAAHLVGPTMRGYTLLGVRSGLDVTTKVNGVRFRCENTQSFTRARHTYAKEAEVVAWIDSIPREAVLWDVGANIGTLSLYAASVGIKVIAFEPMPQNYFALCRNVRANDFGRLVTPLCVALYSESKIGMLNCPSDDIGTALSVFDRTTDYLDRKFTADYSVAAVSLTADQAVSTFGISAPTHIKLDVDGNEPDILRGAKSVLKSTTLRQVLIEVTAENAENTRSVYSLMADHGFTPSTEVTARSENVLFKK